MTEKIYLKDAYCSVFSAVVESCEVKDARYSIVLNKTAFFPEGGGQAADKGTINGIPVVDVKLQGNDIIHILEAELQVGEEVNCVIDWDLRYARMQGHTGEHIISGIVKSLYMYDNVGFHMSDKLITVDFNGSMTLDDIVTIEIKSNEAIYKNADVVAYYPTIQELETLEFRSKKELTADLRIVTISENIDCCACCAPHVAKTGEVGIIKVIDSYPYKKGTRIEMLAGKNALIDYIEINKYLKELMKVTSSPRNVVVDTIRERYGLYQELSNNYKKISRRLALSELELCEIDNLVYSITDNLTFEDLRYCANEITKEHNICLLLSKKEDEYLYVVSSKEKDVRPIARTLNDSFDGKGGGKSEYSQGKISYVSLNEIKGFINNILKKEV